MPEGKTLRILKWRGPDASTRRGQRLSRSAACQPYLRGVTIGFVARVTCTVCANGGTDGSAPVIPPGSGWSGEEGGRGCCHLLPCTVVSCSLLACSPRSCLFRWWLPGGGGFVARGGAAC